MYEILIFCKYINIKKEVKVNNLTPDYGQVLGRLDPLSSRPVPNFLDSWSSRLEPDG